MPEQEVGEPRWPWAKVARAQEHAQQLDGRMAVWQALNPVTFATSIAEDRLSWSIKLRLRSAPPLEEWSLLAGDCIHNLRSALDSLVWTLADMDKLTDRQKTALAFPLLLDPTKWDDAAARSLRSLSAEHIERIKQGQPFQRPESEREGDGLALLHYLDIADKHRVTLRADVQTSELVSENTVEFFDEEAQRRNVPPNTAVHEFELRDDALILSGQTVDPIARILGYLNVTLRIGFQLPRALVPVSDLLGGLQQHVSQAIDVISRPTDE